MSKSLAMTQKMIMVEAQDDRELGEGARGWPTRGG